MLRNTLCHLPGIGERTERRLWSRGLLSWDQCLDDIGTVHSGSRLQRLREGLEESKARLLEGNPGFFARLLPPQLHWRLFPEFRDRLAYLDIETTGMNTWDHSITAISLYDGRQLRQYVQGRNLEDFEADVDNYQVLVTSPPECPYQGDPETIERLRALLSGA